MSDVEQEKEEEPKITTGTSDKKRKQAAVDPSRSSKRERKAADTFAPTNFNVETKNRINVVEGRGKKLRDIQPILEVVEAASKNSLELKNAHKLLYPVRGKTVPQEMRSNLLEFNGYLPVVEGEDEEKRAKMEEDAEAKVSQRAYKFKLLEVKNLCDFFHVDRSGKSTKDDLIDALLDFLGETNEDLLKSSSNKSAPKKKAVVKKKRAPATKKKVVDDDEEEEEEDKDEEEEEDLAEDKEEEDKEIDKEEKDDRVENNEPKQITDKALRRWVQAYVACFNMDKATIKHAMETASDKFGINLKGKKAKIRQFLTEEM